VNTHNTYVTDMRHFLDDDGEIVRNMPSEARYGRRPYLVRIDSGLTMPLSLVNPRHNVKVSSVEAGKNGGIQDARHDPTPLRLSECEALA